MKHEGARNTVTHMSRSEEETIGLGAALGRALAAGDVVALNGDLGAGKTMFTKGILKGLGYTEWQRVKSPTFTLVHEIASRIPVYHFDVYRLEHEEELSEIGFDEFCGRGGIVIVEWAQKFPAMFGRDAVLVTLEHQGNDLRQVTITASSSTMKKMKQ